MHLNDRFRLRFRRVTACAVMLVVLTALSGCAGPTPSPIVSPVNSPIAQPTKPPVVATQDVKLGQMRGRLFVRRGTRSVPMKSVIIFLGPIVRSDVTGGEGVVALDPVNAPQAEVAEDGTFLIRNVPPGRYGLVADIDDEKLLLNNPKDGTAFVQEVKGTETVDLGDLTYSDLPYVERP